MSKKLSFLTAVLALIVLLIPLCTVAYADVEDGESSGGDIVYTDPIYTDDPYYTEAPVYTDPPVYTEAPAYTEAPVYTDPPAYDDPYDEPSNEYDDSYDGNSYIGGGQTYTPPESTAPSVPLYEVKNDVDNSELSSNDWKEITANLKTVDADTSDGDDFNFIKNNNSLSDDGEWMLILSIVLLVLGFAGIGYVVASMIMRKKRIPKRQYAAAGGAPTNGRYRPDDYNDGYRASPKSEKSASKNRHRFDTGEVTVSHKSSGGKRYR